MNDSIKAHYYKVLPLVHSQGFADAIHYAPDWQTRADALYARISDMSKELELIGHVDARLLPSPERLAIWPGGGIGLLADGRMAAHAETSDEYGNKTVLFAVTE